MADPVHLSRAATAAQVMGQLFGGVQAQNTAEAQAEALDYEAKIAGQQSRAEEAVQRRAARQFLSEQSAAIAESGGGFTDTARKTIEDTGTNLELEALNTRYAGALRRRGLGYQANAARATGRNALLTGIAGSGAAALAGMADDQYYRARRDLMRSG